ncbi:MAG: DEAD/DEAH box helicase [Candidatus Aceula lacicola]|nr:DEAD/DEAH box helicase [Candidatus Aceula lacicola]
MKSFEELGLSVDTLKTIKAKGFEEPSPIQEKTIPVILSGTEDVVGQAQTGTGKTAAFGLPLVELLEEKSKHVQALVLTPTRELAIQVAEEIHSLRGKKHLTTIPIYGGQAIQLQLRSLQKGIDIVVGTPGRILDHLKRKSLNLSSITHLVLDEADEMLNMGFLEDVQKIMNHTSKEKRTMLFSATMPSAIMQIAKKYMNDYVILKITKDKPTSNLTEQIYFEVNEQNKFEALCRIIDIEEDFFGLIFCRTKIDVGRVANRLTERGYQSDALHGDISQSLREKILNRFKKRKINVLVATDVAARGIDVQDISHVINYALPQDPEAYIHRIGRTGRAGKTGHAITFVTPAEYRKLQFIQQKAKTDIRREKLPKVKDIIEMKKQRIHSRLEDIIEKGPKQEYLQLAKDLLNKNESENLLGALLQHSFRGELDEKSYTEIVNTPLDNSGKTRLFVGFGKSSGLTRKKLIDVVKEHCNISTDKIHDIQVRDKFAFISLPFNEAEQILEYFQKNRNQSGLYITKAKKDQGQGNQKSSGRQDRPKRQGRSRGQENSRKRHRPQR